MNEKFKGEYIGIEGIYYSSKSKETRIRLILALVNTRSSGKR